MSCGAICGEKLSNKIWQINLIIKYIVIKYYVDRRICSKNYSTLHHSKNKEKRKKKKGYYNTFHFIEKWTRFYFILFFKTNNNQTQKTTQIVIEAL